ncbi:MAG: orotidine-5'-phosphate decarboxylase [Candidatus Parabeggiatoa sp. nov. 3]|nr:MAG: orotidine-5'-phosphate decarboxylase [Gammaproteobacteria bacterium]RKZ54216.1 MAG: orotidine-5'-phosphate decarboxylase [Gammaproteobacteria bacterium]RKZ88997.1 MAG: orotidine-5'-phosphate decarboxylase [Gammaproteobacteria bacterium]HEW97821.1 orotidine-5'-phosphate decarboxylase [Beggiatoa sp.]
MLMSPLIVALDFAQAEPALALAKQLGCERCRIKIGKELFTRCGPALVEQLVKEGFEIFLDLKYHDIPNTVAQACLAAADLGVWMINVHALGGRDMLLAAREALEKRSHRPLLVAVTILTSLQRFDLYAIGLHGLLEENVLRLARLSNACGLDGIVCSPHEIVLIRQAVDNNFKLVTPGIRPLNSSNDDQKRVMTPAEALKLGANYLVVGRPVTAAPEPLQALLEIEASLSKNNNQ